MTIGEKIRRARENRGIEMMELCRLLGWRSRSRLRAVEAATGVTTTTLDRIATALGTTAAEIVAIGERRAQP